MLSNKKIDETAGSQTTCENKWYNSSMQDLFFSSHCVHCFMSWFRQAYWSRLSPVRQWIYLTLPEGNWVGALHPYVYLFLHCVWAETALWPTLNKPPRTFIRKHMRGKQGEKESVLCRLQFLYSCRSIQSHVPAGSIPEEQQACYDCHHKGRRYQLVALDTRLRAAQGDSQQNRGFQERWLP